MKEVNKNTVRDLREKNNRLHRAVNELSVLNDLALDIGGRVNSEKIMRTIISRSIRAVVSEQGDITLVDEDSTKSGQTLVRSMVSTASYSPLHLDQNLLGWMQIHKEPLVINNPDTDPRFREVKWESSIHSVLSVPMIVKSKLIGILTVYNKKYGEVFSESDCRLLSIIAAQSAQVVDNARLYEEEQAYREIQRELEFASDIQKKLLPSNPPNITGYRVAGKNITAYSVGGDYFDFIPLGQQFWAICLGDVSGKGMPASLLMSNLQAILRSHLIHHVSPGKVLEIANHQLFKHTDTEKFATLFLGILDIEKNVLNYSNGGHEYPYLLSADEKNIRLQTGGLPLGMFDHQEYQESTIELESGDCMFIYSDGITESMNKDEEEFGENRLEEMLFEVGNKYEAPEEIIEKIFEASIKHSNQKKLSDDMTAVVVFRNP